MVVHVDVNLNIILHKHNPKLKHNPTAASR